MATVYLGLGSNLDDRHSNLQKAREWLNRGPIKIVKTSSVIETDPVGGPPQGKFLNQVICVETKVSAFELLALCQAIEVKMGRVKSVLNGPRIIDIDILIYADIMIKTPALTIPHPRMFERDFVLKPLNEIAPTITKKYSYANH